VGVNISYPPHPYPLPPGERRLIFYVIPNKKQNLKQNGCSYSKLVLGNYLGFEICGLEF
jgi:hypothetical protein